MYLLDTMVVSEPTKANPQPSVLKWLSDHPLPAQFLSVLTIGEIHFGIDKLAPLHPRRDRLRKWLERDLTSVFAGRILDIDAKAALAWSNVRARKSETLSPIDSLIAATALAHGLAVVTRNTRHFENLGLRLINPWP